MTMHENIAKAIYTSDWGRVPGCTWEGEYDDYKGVYREFASVALAVLATPTPAMLDAGAEALREHFPKPHYGPDHTMTAPCPCGWDYDRTDATGYVIQIEQHRAAAVYAAMVAAAGDAS